MSLLLISGFVLELHILLCIELFGHIKSEMDFLKKAFQFGFEEVIVSLIKGKF